MPHDPLRVNHEKLFQGDQSPPLESDNVSAYRLHCVRFHSFLQSSSVSGHHFKNELSLVFCATIVCDGACSGRLSGAVSCSPGDLRCPVHCELIWCMSSEGILASVLDRLP